MKSKNLLSALAIVLSAACASQAHATPVTVVEQPTPNNVVVDSTHSYIFTYDLTQHGFILGSTQYTSGSLEVRLTDTTGNENGVVKYGVQTKDFGNVKNQTYNDPSPSGLLVDIALNSVALADLNADGKLDISISSTSNTFYFADATLSVNAQSVTPPPSTSVPEPVSLALIGAGLAGMGAIRRRKNRA